MKALILDFIQRWAWVIVAGSVWSVLVSIGLAVERSPALFVLCCFPVWGPYCVFVLLPRS